MSLNQKVTMVFAALALALAPFLSGFIIGSYRLTSDTNVIYTDNDRHSLSLLLICRDKMPALSCGMDGEGLRSDARGTLMVLASSSPDSAVVTATWLFWEPIFFLWLQSSLGGDWLRREHAALSCHFTGDRCEEATTAEPGDRPQGARGGDAK